MQDEGKSPDDDNNEADKAIVYYLGTCDSTPFKVVCNCNSELLGGPGTELRRVMQYRVKYLRTHPKTLEELFHTYFPHSVYSFILAASSQSAASSVHTSNTPSTVGSVLGSPVTPGISTLISPSPNWSLPKP